MIKAILFDFFGTLVNYSASRTQQGYLKTYQLMRESGARQSYEQFLSAWSAVFQEFDTWAKEHQREFLMHEVVTRYTERYCDGPVPLSLISRISQSYIEEWEAGISYIPGLHSLLRDAQCRYRLGVVSNTHYPPLIHSQLQRMNVESCFSLVVTSAEMGRPKPHAEIYAHALALLALQAHEVLFVGDSLEADVYGPLRAGMIPLHVDPSSNGDAPHGLRIASVTQTLSWLEGRETIS